MRIRIWTVLATTLLTACAVTGAEHGTTTTSAGGGATTGGSSTGGHGTGATSSGTTSGTTTSGTTSSGTTGGSSNVTVYVTPDSGMSARIASAIDAATSSIHMTMYILDESDIVTALANRAKAGLDVRVVLNQTFPSGTSQTNPATATTLTTAGAHVVWRNGPPGAAAGAFTHEKTFILDGKQAWIMTMNLDYSAPLYNREYVVVDDVAADVQEADQIFLADYNGTATTDGSPLVVSPNNARSSLVALINSATKTVDVEVEEFSDNYNPGVTSAVAAAAKRGVATRVIVANGSTSSTMTTAISTVKAAGAKVVVSGGTSGGGTAQSPYIHAKAITIDCTGTTCASGFLGSENFSGGSLGYNRELGLIINNATELAKVQAAINTDFAAGTLQ